MIKKKNLIENRQKLLMLLGIVGGKKFHLVVTVLNFRNRMLDGGEGCLTESSKGIPGFASFTSFSSVAAI